MSVWSAAYFNRLAAARGLRERAIARAAVPSFSAVPFNMTFALAIDGFRLDGYRPQVISADDVRAPNSSSPSTRSCRRRCVRASRVRRSGRVSHRCVSSTSLRAGPSRPESKRWSSGWPEHPGRRATDVRVYGSPGSLPPVWCPRAWLPARAVGRLRVRAPRPAVLQGPGGVRGFLLQTRDGLVHGRRWLWGCCACIGAAWLPRSPSAWSWPASMARHARTSMPRSWCARPALEVVRRPDDPQAHLESRARTAAGARVGRGARGARRGRHAWRRSRRGRRRARERPARCRPARSSRCSEIDRVLARRPDAYGLVFERGRALLALGRTEDAAQDFGRAIAAMPHAAPEHVFARRDALLALGRAGAALAALDAGMARIGRVAVAPAGGDRPRGAARRTSTPRSRASTSCIDAASRNPAWIARRGEILERAGRNAEARAEYERRWR